MANRTRTEKTGMILDTYHANFMTMDPKIGNFPKFAAFGDFYCTACNTTDKWVPCQVQGETI